MGPSGFAQIISELQLTWDVEEFYTETQLALGSPAYPTGLLHSAPRITYHRPRWGQGTESAEAG